MNDFLKALRGQTVALDTMIFIYAFEGYPVYGPFLRAFFQAVEKGKIEAATSTITITECLVQPYRQRDMALAAKYMILFRNFPHLSVIPVTDEVAERAALIRAHYHLKTPDAIQLSTALISGSHAFLTNDEEIPEVEGIQVLILDRNLKP